MTRHTRNRQKVKLGKGFMWAMNVPIDMIRKEKEVWGLDQNFEWCRYSRYKSDKLLNAIKLPTDRPLSRIIPIKEYK